MKISFVGLGKLGLPLATSFAANGVEVLAIDKNEELIQKLNNDEVPWVESQMPEMLKQARPNITYVNSYSDIASTDVTVILVNTPSIKKDGSFSNLYVEQTIESICKELVKAGKKGHHFILSSTVMPGSIEGTFIPLIESLTGWEFNKHQFGFSHVPDFVAIGQIYHDFANPDFLMIGSSTKAYASEAKELYLNIIVKGTPIKILSLAEAELAKVALNAYITTKISFANYLGILAKKLNPNINVDTVTETIALDKRIGNKYFKAGNSYGGTCFPRDTWAFIRVSESVGLDAPQMKANEAINNAVDGELISSILKKEPFRIGIVGCGFKPGTSVVTEGLATKIVKRLSKYGMTFQCYDFEESAIKNLREDNPKAKIISHSTIKTVYQSSDVVIWCVNDPKYLEASYNGTVALFNDDQIIDPWRLR